VRDCCSPSRGSSCSAKDVLASIGAAGTARPISWRRTEGPVAGSRAIAETTARDLITLMERAIEAGTGTRAAVPGYRIAGKTGTARKAIAGRYMAGRYVAVFAGLAPASAPRLACVVVIDEPGGRAYHGGDVAAPVFAEFMSSTLRLLGEPADAVASARSAAAGAIPPEPRSPAQATR
jgi:cell division protein FtsI (penicillin-binding protein 3)